MGASEEGGGLCPAVWLWSAVATPAGFQVAQASESARVKQKAAEVGPGRLAVALASPHPSVSRRPTGLEPASAATCRGLVFSRLF